MSASFGHVLVRETEPQQGKGGKYVKRCQGLRRALPGKVQDALVIHVALTNYHELGGLKQQKCLLSESRSPEAGGRVSFLWRLSGADHPRPVS